MEQILFTPPPQPHASGSASSGGTTDSQPSESPFAPFLSDAMDNTSAAEKTPENSAAQTADNPVNQFTSQETATASQNTNSFQFIAETESSLQGILNLLAGKLTPEVTNTSPEAKIRPQATTNNQAPALLIASENQLEQISSLLSQNKQIPDNLKLVITQAASQTQTFGTVEPSATATTSATTSATTENSTMQQPAMAKAEFWTKIQQILNSANEKSVAIIRFESPAQRAVQPNSQNTAPIFLENNQNVQAVIKQIIEINTQTNTGTEITSISKDSLLEKATSLKTKAVHGQYIEAKTKAGKNFVVQPQGTNQETVANQAQTNTAQQILQQPAQESQSSFATHLQTVVQQSATQQSAASHDTVLQQPFTDENSVMNQVVKKFYANPRLQTSKVTMQLNPAELGQLKIDIVVKGDTVKANIVAQTQQAQEIIDRNMTRLRSVLEEQGLSIDELNVSFNLEENKDFNLFQEDFSNPDQFAFNNSNTKNNGKIFGISTEEEPVEEVDTTKTDNGVNVKA